MKKKLKYKSKDVFIIYTLASNPDLVLVSYTEDGIGQFLINLKE